MVILFFSWPRAVHALCQRPSALRQLANHRDRKALIQLTCRFPLDTELLLCAKFNQKLVNRCSQWQGGSTSILVGFQVHMKLLAAMLSTRPGPRKLYPPEQVSGGACGNPLHPERGGVCLGDIGVLLVGSMSNFAWTLLDCAVQSGIPKQASGTISFAPL